MNKRSYSLTEAQRVELVRLEESSKWLTEGFKFIPTLLNKLNVKFPQIGTIATDISLDMEAKFIGWAPFGPGHYTQELQDEEEFTVVDKNGNAVAQKAWGQFSFDEFKTYKNDHFWIREASKAGTVRAWSFSAEELDQIAERIKKQDWTSRAIAASRKFPDEIDLGSLGIEFVSIGKEERLGPDARFLGVTSAYHPQNGSGAIPTRAVYKIYQPDGKLVVEKCFGDMTFEEILKYSTDHYWILAIRRLKRGRT